MKDLNDPFVFWLEMLKRVVLPAAVVELILMTPAAFMPQPWQLIYVTGIAVVGAVVVWQTVVRNNPPWPLSKWWS